MQFPAKKNAGSLKAPRNFSPRKGDIVHPSSSCLGTPLRLPKSLYGRTDVRTYGRTRADVTTKISRIDRLPNFLTRGATLCSLRPQRSSALNSRIAEHHLQTNHRIDWDFANCITYSTGYYQQITLESWFTYLEQTPLNRCQQLLAPYKRLIDDTIEQDRQTIDKILDLSTELIR